MNHRENLFEINALMYIRIQFYHVLKTNIHINFLVFAKISATPPYMEGPCHALLDCDYISEQLKKCPLGCDSETIVSLKTMASVLFSLSLQI